MASDVAKVDANYVPVALAINASDELKQILIDSATGRILIDLVIE